MICPKRKHSLPFPDSLDVTAIGERGQVVIPIKIREALGLRPGGKMVTFMHGDGAIILLPAARMKSLLKEMRVHFLKADKLIKSL